MNLKRSAFILMLVAVFVMGYGVRGVLAQTSAASASYVPLIGITSVPEPLALPNGASNVTYHYAVKNFLQEAPLTDVRVVDDKCAPVQFVSGDLNGNGELDYGETWIYACTTKLATTTESIATATGIANNITATHDAYATVVVGSNNPPPLVSIVNITKVAYPLSLPAGGGEVAFTYKVTNPGIVPLSNVIVSDDKCSAMSGELGDTNDNHLLDPSEVWIYTCVTILTKTTTNTATVTAYANGLKAIDTYTITVAVATTTTPGLPNEGSNPSVPGFPNNGPNPGLPNNGTNPNGSNITLIIWGILGGILVALIIVFFLTRKKK
jgi:hypothetical protein